MDDSDFNGETSCFVSNEYPVRSVSQDIKFKDYGLNNNIMKTLQPDIELSAW